MNTTSNVSSPGTDFSMLAWTTASCSALLLYRISYSNSWYYVFLLWNLFLAMVPLFISWLLPYVSKRWYLGLCFIWVLFLPNAPYLITDIIHLKSRSSIPLWYDALLLFSFALAGIWMWVRSIERWAQACQIDLLHRWMVPVLFGLNALIGYGIFMGRILRFNSWDLFVRPSVVLENAWFFLDDARAILMTGSFSIMLTCMIVVYIKFKRDHVARLFEI
ncbi:MAG: DUF1361 domain-containing protein [Cytophagaceae bacterium]|nr:DUF1361 domain-containing protein [Cytophagaceae bacterium]